MVERISFDRVADVYDETRGLPPRVLAKAAGFLAKELQGKRVLEIGVGTGRIAVPLQKSGINLVGIDIAPQMVAHGREKGLRSVVFADGARLPFRDGRSTRPLPTMSSISSQTGGMSSERWSGSSGPMGCTSRSLSTPFPPSPPTSVTGRLCKAWGGHARILGSMSGTSPKSSRPRVPRT